MTSGEAGLPDDRVRQALADLGADAATAPDVPTAVTARIGAALRAAPPPAAHAIRSTPRLSRLRLIGVLIGVGATAAAVVVGTATLLRNAPSKPAFPAGPTAERITVSVSPSTGDTPKAVVTRP